MASSFTPPPDGDQNVGLALLKVATATVILVLITGSLRMYVRARIVRIIGWDDWIMVFSIVRASDVSKLITIPGH